MQTQRQNQKYILHTQKRRKDNDSKNIVQIEKNNRLTNTEGDRVKRDMCKD